MLDHVSIPVADLDAAAAFYDAVLEPLGMRRTKELPGAVGFGSPGGRAPVFWLMDRRGEGSARPGIGLHLSFSAPDPESVDAFFSVALERGARPVGSPGPRPEYTQPFYGAFVLDLDGFKIEAVCREVSVR